MVHWQSWLQAAVQGRLAGQVQYYSARWVPGHIVCDECVQLHHSVKHVHNPRLHRFLLDNRLTGVYDPECCG